MNKKYKGIICILISAFCFSLMNAFVRLSGDLPSIQKAFFRNSVSLIFALVMLMKSHTRVQWGKKNTWPLFIRCLFGTIGILCNFYAVDHLVLADASMLNKMSPFFAIIFSFIILGEKINIVQISGVLIAFVGSLFIIKPTFSNMELIPSLAGLAGGLGAGIAYTMVRKLGQNGVKSPVIVFCFSAFSCLTTLPYLILHYHPMSWSQFGYLMLAGLAATGGQFGITTAYCYAPAKEISVYDYSQVVFAAIIGFILFGQMPDCYSIIGYVMICSMAIYMFFYNKRHN